MKLHHRVAPAKVCVRVCTRVISTASTWEFHFNWSYFSLALCKSAQFLPLTCWCLCVATEWCRRRRLWHFKHTSKWLLIRKNLFGIVRKPKPNVCFASEERNRILKRLIQSFDRHIYISLAAPAFLSMTMWFNTNYIVAAKHFNLLNLFGETPFFIPSVSLSRLRKRLFICFSFLLNFSPRLCDSIWYIPSARQQFLIYYHFW